MTNDELKTAMNVILADFKKNNDAKKAIGSAVSLGMKYEMEKVKEGIDIVFTELNK